MSMVRGSGVPLSGLRSSAALRGVAITESAEGGKAERVVLVGDLEQIRQCRSGTVVVLQSSLARSAWAVSVALRYAWERNLTLVIAQLDPASAPAAVRLAERLGVPLGNSEGDLAALALALAVELGDPETASARLLSRLALDLAEQPTTQGVLRALERHLPDSTIQLVTRVATDPVEPGEAAGSVEVPIGPSDLVPGRALRATVPHRNPNATEIVRQALNLARAPVIASEARQDLDRVEAGRLEQWLLATVLDEEESEGSSSEELSRCRPEWFAGDGTVVAALMCRDAKQQLSESLDVVLANRLRLGPGTLGPVRVDDGWVFWCSFAVAEGLSGLDALEDAAKAARHELRDALRTAIDRLDIGLDVVAALGPFARSREDLRRSLRLAFLGAEAQRHAERQRIPYVGSFGSTHAVAAVASLARSMEIADEVLRPLTALEDSDQLLETLGAYLDSGGSTIRCAEILACHRNTVTARLDRIRQAGLDVENPGQRLGLHLAVRLRSEFW